MELSKKEKVRLLLKSIETGEQDPVSYINPNKYIQHNLNATDGLAGFSELMKKLPVGSARANTVRIYQDGDFVFSHSEYNFFGPKIGFDIFRFEDGRIVEHWDNLQETARPNPSNHTMTDGPTDPGNNEQTEVNKDIVKHLIDDILINGKMDKLPGYFNGDNYIQHNPLIPDTLSGLARAIGEWSSQGILLKYKKLHMLLGEGNFVLAVSEGHFGETYNAFYDLFRVENGKIAEHWDVIEEIPPVEKWMNKNGKF